MKTLSKEAKWVVFTPEKAKVLLDKNLNNRKFRQSLAEKYAEDMASGKWTRCIVPIAIYEDGNIADGQHRLAAILMSRTTQKFLLLEGLTKEDGLNIDTGKFRTLVDNAHISGVDPDLTAEKTALARAIQEGDRGAKAYPNSMKLEFVSMHREAVEWTVKNGPTGKGIRNQIILAAVARAFYYEENKEKLIRFCKVLGSGFAQGDHESAAIALRNYLMSRPGTDHKGMFREIFLKAMNACAAFMKGKKLTMLKAVKEEAYPLPKQFEGKVKRPRLKKVDVKEVIEQKKKAAK
jgi:hypothetical protein